MEVILLSVLNNKNFKALSSKLIKLVLVFLIIATALAELYHVTNQFISNTWLSAAMVNSFFALLTLSLVRSPVVAKQVGLSFVDNHLTTFILKSPQRIYYPALFILFASIVLGLASYFFSDAQPKFISWPELCWVIWIPVVEEIFFRKGLSGYFKSQWGVGLGIYFSALFFAYIHSYPTVERVLTLDVGIPLGPFLLAVICEYLYTITGKLPPIIAFHAACNGTVVIFSILDSRWLTWLDFLYL